MAVHHFKELALRSAGRSWASGFLWFLLFFLGETKGFPLIWCFLGGKPRDFRLISEEHWWKWWFHPRKNGGYPFIQTHFGGWGWTNKHGGLKEATVVFNQQRMLVWPTALSFLPGRWQIVKSWLTKMTSSDGQILKFTSHIVFWVG